MNKSIIDCGNAIFVSDESGNLQERERTTSLETLVQENVVEEIENQLKEIGKSYNNTLQQKNCFQNVLRKLLIVSIGGGIALIIFIILVNPSEVLTLLALESLLAIADLGIFSGVKKCNYEIDVHDLQSAFLLQQLDKEKDLLEQLKEKDKKMEDNKKLAEVTVKTIDDTNKINQIRAILGKLHTYAEKLYKQKKIKCFNAEIRNDMIKEGIDAEIIDNYLLTYSRKG